MRPLRHALILLTLVLLAFGAIYWQAGQAGASGEVPRLICPLH
jgi:hypothetical protein